MVNRSIQEAALLCSFRHAWWQSWGTAEGEARTDRYVEAASRHIAGYQNGVVGVAETLQGLQASALLHACMRHYYQLHTALMYI